MDEPRDAAQAVSDLEHRLTPLSDPGQRMLRAADLLAAMPAVEAVAMIEHLLIVVSPERADGARIALDALIDALNHGVWPAPHLAACRAEAFGRDLREAVRFLAAPDESASAGEMRQKIPPYDRERPLTLGERKSLAKRPSRNLIQLAVRDPDPAVIRELLRNTHVTEEDVIRIAASRESGPQVLIEVARSLKWIRSHRVAVTLVRNPVTPLDVALRLLPRLRSPDLEAIGGDGNLHPALRRACEDRRAIRRQRRKEGRGARNPATGT